MSRPETFDNRDRKSASGLTHVNVEDEPNHRVNWGAAKSEESARWDDVHRMREALDHKTPGEPHLAARGIVLVIWHETFRCVHDDADGICTLHQLRLAKTLKSVLVTGVKRDVQLLTRVPIGPA